MPRDMSKWRGSYPRRRNAIVAAAWADPNTRCMMPGCGLTHAEYLARGHTPGQARWVSDHVNPALGHRSPLRPAHARCNGQDGGRRGAAVVHAKRNARRRSPNA